MIKFKRFVVSFLILSVVVWSVPAKADDPWRELGLGTASVLASAIYSPLKIQYAALGAFFGGVTWVVTGGNTKFAEKIWTPALGGDYIITPRVLRDRL